MDSLPEVEIFTDGACKRNPAGPGGYAAIIVTFSPDGDDWREMSGYQKKSTNNQMEMMGAIVALESLKEPSQVKVTSDSQYLVHGAKWWVAAWAKNGWKTQAGADVKNKELWLRLLKAAKPHRMSWKWVRGHSGHPENERCDKLAQAAIREGRFWQESRELEAKFFVRRRDMF